MALSLLGLNLFSHSFAYNQTFFYSEASGSEILCEFVWLLQGFALVSFGEEIFLLLSSFCK